MPHDTPENIPERIAIWGYGQEGQAALSYIQKKYSKADITIIDRHRPHGLEGVDFMSEASAPLLLENGTFDMLIKSPGVSLYLPEIQKAMKKGTNVTSGTNLWFEENPDAAVVAVTGTKGKSTTASLIHHLLLKCGLKSVLAGNIGKPLISTKPGKDVTVLELSSYQIADLAHHPEVAVLTNLYEAHLEWHGDRTSYHNDKMRLFNLSRETTAVIAHDEDTAQKYLGDRENLVYFGGNTGDLKIPNALNKPHNLRNISAALTVIEVLNALDRLPTDALEDFEPLPHRQEVVGERGGILYINDSISTVPETTAVALQAYKDKPVALIIGGEEKNQNYGPVRTAVEKHGQTSVFCVPDSGKRIVHDFGGAELCINIKDAVKKAERALKKTGGYVILSPGTPSFPIFKNYIERGNHFKKACGFGFENDNEA